MLDVVYRDAAEFRAVFVEVVDHADRVLDQRGVVLHAVTSVDRQARIGQFRGEDRSLAVLGERLLGVRGDVKSLERLDPVFQAVGAVNRVVAGILALLKHQAADVFFTRFGRLQRHGRRGRGVFALAAEREGEERLVGVVDAFRHGVEIEVEGRVALRFVGRYGFLGEVFVADDLVDREGLLGHRVAAEAGHLEQDLRRVEDRHVAEIA